MLYNFTNAYRKQQTGENETNIIEQFNTIQFNKPTLDQVVHPYQKFVGYEEVSALHQRLVMIL